VISALTPSTEARATVQDSVGAALHRRLAAEPNRIVLRLVDETGISVPVSALALEQRAAAYAAFFSAHGAPGKVVAVCLYHGLDLYAAFIGAVWSGCIPTMLPPPSPRIEPHKYVRSFTHMRQHVRPFALVLDARTREALASVGGLLISDVLLVDPHSLPQASLSTVWPSEQDDIVLLQHSSGTTGLQKGIALSNKSVLAHNAAYIRALAMTAEDIIVSWLPLYHDMGFIACFILPLLNGIPVVAISPFDWVRSPALLLDKIHEHRGTLCWLPNFAFAFMARGFRESRHGEALDLSSVRAWINSSEPVLDASHRSFAERFSRFGVSARQLTASYAMAENVYAVTQTKPGELISLDIDTGMFRKEHRVCVSPKGNSPNTMRVVSNGHPLEGTAVRIIDETDHSLPDDMMGEIAIRGDYMFSGYFRRPDLTKAATTVDGWYRTGDLGFLHENQLYVTGRKKDLIIIQGRNFYPGDIEKAAADVEGVVPGRIVAFGLADERSGTEGLVILAEATTGENEAPAIAVRIRNAIAQEFDCTPSVVRIVPSRWLIKSSSGKLARGENRDKYLASLSTA
jgi:fatty-acyl-CoA synthase